jgi:formylglycine-generating enzyme required for sulfatase activity
VKHRSRVLGGGWVSDLFVVALLVWGGTPSAAEAGATPSSPGELVLVQGGTFRMGDLFGDGQENERPVHTVTLRSFMISSTEVTVGQFRQFVAATSYRTSAEHPENTDGFEKTMARVGAGAAPGADRLLLRYRLLQEVDGAAIWDSNRNRWLPYASGSSWKSPGFAQTDEHPVVAVSWDDAIRYCNWLSRKHGLAPAYDEESGRLLDSSGRPAASVDETSGYRLPTEAEWEYAARAGGREVRFGSGQNVARAAEINFRADAGTYAYLEKGTNRKGTVVVGSLPPNALGLYEMSGNAWEWVSDHHATYTGEDATDPYSMPPAGALPQQTLRGGRWGGDASEVRVSARSWWLRNDRCNNSGFRIARSEAPARR